METPKSFWGAELFDRLLGDRSKASQLKQLKELKSQQLTENVPVEQCDEDDDNNDNSNGDNKQGGQEPAKAPTTICDPSRSMCQGTRTEAVLLTVEPNIYRQALFD